MLCHLFSLVIFKTTNLFTQRINVYKTNHQGKTLRLNFLQMWVSIREALLYTCSLLGICRHATKPMQQHFCLSRLVCTVVATVVVEVGVFAFHSVSKFPVFFATGRATAETLFLFITPCWVILQRTLNTFDLWKVFFFGTKIDEKCLDKS